RAEAPVPQPRAWLEEHPEDKVAQPVAGAERVEPATPAEPAGSGRASAGSAPPSRWQRMWRWLLGE
ncbi:hypothetical protein, partial [Streptomyces recifensis]